MYYDQDRFNSQEEVMEIVNQLLQVQDKYWTKLENGMESEFQKLKNENARLKHLVGKLIKQRSFARLHTMLYKKV